MKRLAVLGALVLAACDPAAGTGPKTASSGPVIDGGVARFLPAKGDVVLAYKTEDLATGSSGMAMMRVVPRGERRAEITGGKKPSSIVYDDKGIRRVPEDTYLLVWPATEGRSWPVGPMATARIRSVTATVTVPAGTFHGCIEVVEERKTTAAGAVIVTTFCPDVGIVLLDAEGTGKDGTAHERMVLQSAGKAVSIDDVK